MDKQYITTSVSPRIIIDVSGDLRIKGQDELEVTAKSTDSESLVLESQNDEITIRCRSDCSIRVPREATLNVQAARGDASIKVVEGEIAIDSVAGDLDLRSVGSTRINRVNGDLAAKNVEGELTLDSVSGDVSLRSIQGDFAVNGMINGNLSLSGIEGSAKGSANGNINLRLDPSPGHDFEFTCNGNIFCRLSDDASAEISVTRASQVRVDLPGIRSSAPVSAPYALTLGEGDARITLSANGNVVLDTHSPDWDMEDFEINVDSEVNGMADAIGEQISQQVESQVRMMEDQLNAQLSSLTMRLSSAHLTEDQARRIEDRARAASVRAAERAQERMRRAQARMEQKMAAAQRKMEYKAQAMERAARHSHRNWNFTVPTPPGASPAPEEPVTEDERLVILRMLEEKKITMEEADQLLQALEGKQ
jgi:SHOCT-like domain/Toastrack DUF4097